MKVILKNMKKRWSLKTVLKEIATTVIMLFIISSILNYIRKPNISPEIPDIKLQLIDGREVNLKGGEPLVLHFWATWCPTCRFEAPNLESIKDSGVQLITVAVNSGDDSTLKHFMEKNGYSYSVVNDMSGELAERFNVELFPPHLYMIVVELYGL